MKTIRSAMAELLQWPAFSWLQPKATVRVRQADGSTILMQGGRRLTTSKRSPAGGRFVALVLSPEDYLMRELALPDMPHDEVEHALQLEVASHSPFPESDTVWGWRVERHGEVISATVAMTSRKLVDSRLLRQEWPERRAPEVWADWNPPLVLSGFGEGRRKSAERRMTITMLAAVAILISGLLVLALTPFLQLRLQLHDAADQLTNLQRTAAEVVAQREALVRSHAQAGAIQAALDQRADPLGVLETLAVLLPDSAHLLDLDVTADRVRITGVSANASALIERVGSDTRIRGLRPTSAISRVGPEGEENFSVEFHYEAGSEHLR